jgi:hypothetical protein
MKFFKNFKTKSEITEVINKSEQLFGILYAYREIQNQVSETIHEVHWCIDRILEIPHRGTFGNSRRLEGNLLLIAVYQLILLDKLAISEDIDNLIYEQEILLEELRKVSDSLIINFGNPSHTKAANAFFELEILLDQYYDVFSWPAEFVKIYDINSNTAWEAYLNNPKLFEKYIMQLDNTILFRKSGELYSMTTYNIDCV